MELIAKSKQRGVVQIGATGLIIGGITGLLGLWLWLVVDQRSYDAYAAKEAEQRCEAAKFDLDFARSRGVAADATEKEVARYCGEAEGARARAQESADQARAAGSSVIDAIKNVIGLN